MQPPSARVRVSRVRVRVRVSRVSRVSRVRTRALGLGLQGFMVRA